MDDELSLLQDLVSSVQDQSVVESRVIDDATAEAKERMVLAFTAKVSKLDVRIAKETEKLDRILDKRNPSKTDQDRIQAIQGMMYSLL